MPERDGFILIGMSGLFIFLSLVAFLWSKREEKGYYNSLYTRPDVREFLVHLPERPEPGSLRIGAWIAGAVGLSLVAVGGAFLLWG